MAYNDWGEWEDDEEDPLQYADWTNPETGESHTYTPPPPAEGPIPEGYVPSPYPPPGIDPYEGVTHYIPGPATTPATTTNTPGPNPGPTPGPTVSSSTGGGGGGGGGGQTLLAPYPRTFQRPGQAEISDAVKSALGLLPAVPEFKAPAIPEIQPWSAPSANDVFQDPSFGLRKRVGEQALENSQAARGMVRSGGALKDLLAYNQNFASQEYGNVANRSLEGWKGNTAATLQRAGLDQDRARSMYEPQFAEYQNKVATATRVPEMEYDRSWREFLADYDIWNDQRNFTHGSLMDLSRFGLDAAQ